jgi:hypothetical protein
MGPVCPALVRPFAALEQYDHFSYVGIVDEWQIDFFAPHGSFPFVKRQAGCVVGNGDRGLVPQVHDTFVEIRHTS